MIKINLGYGMTGSCGHLLRTAVMQGTMVKRGDLIGYVGIPDEARARISITP